MRWLARGAGSVPAGLGWLTGAEAARAAGLRYPKRHDEYLLRRLVAKHAVAAAAGLPVDDTALARIEVANAPSGAPYVLLDGEPAGLEVSISDRAGWAVCLVSDAAAGCDLELVEPRSPAFLRDFLSRAERAYVTGHAEPDAVANLIWSAKESTLKALRVGLDRDTRDVEVTVHDGQPGRWLGLAVRAAGEEFSGWWRRDGDYLFTVAARLPGPPPVALEDRPAPPWC